MSYKFRPAVGSKLNTYLASFGSILRSLNHLISTTESVVLIFIQEKKKKKKKTHSKESKNGKGEGNAMLDIHDHLIMEDAALQNKAIKETKRVQNHSGKLE